MTLGTGAGLAGVAVSPPRPHREVDEAPGAGDAGGTGAPVAPSRCVSPAPTAAEAAEPRTLLSCGILQIINWCLIPT